MRLLAASLLLLVSPLLIAQQTPPARLPPQAFTLDQALQRMEPEVANRTAALRRDAFIVSRLVAATAELNSFQKLAAVEAASDHVAAALRRAGEKPQATKATFELLEYVTDDINTAKRQGTMVDLPALKTQILRRTHFLQIELFRQFDDLRRLRQALLDAQAKLAVMTNDMDGAVSEALGSTLDYFKAGGQ